MDKDIPEPSRLGFLENFLANSFALSDAEDNTSGKLNGGGIADLSFLKILLAIRQKTWGPSFWEVINSCFITICKIGIFKNPFVTITILFELFFRFKRFILLVQMKKIISMNYRSSTSSWKQWRWLRLDLIFSISNIHINSNLTPITRFTSSSRSTNLKNVFPWNISQLITKTIPVRLRIVVNYNEMGHPVWIWKAYGNWTTTWSEFPNGGKAIVEQTLVSKDISKSKKQDFENHSQ